VGVTGPIQEDDIVKALEKKGGATSMPSLIEAAGRMNSDGTDKKEKAALPNDEKNFGKKSGLLQKEEDAML